MLSAHGFFRVAYACFKRKKENALHFPFFVAFLRGV